MIAIFVTAALILLALYISYLIIVVHPVDEEQKPIPKADNCNYYRDYCNLHETISGARNLKQLKMARRQVRDLRKKYNGIVKGICVKTDTVKLDEHIETVGVALEQRANALN